MMASPTTVMVVATAVWGSKHAGSELLGDLNPLGDIMVPNMPLHGEGIWMKYM